MLCYYPIVIIIYQKIFVADFSPVYLRKTKAIKGKKHKFKKEIYIQINAKK